MRCRWSNLDARLASMIVLALINYIYVNKPGSRTLAFYPCQKPFLLPSVHTPPCTRPTSLHVRAWHMHSSRHVAGYSSSASSQLSWLISGMDHCLLHHSTLDNAISVSELNRVYTPISYFVTSSSGSGDSIQVTEKSRVARAMVGLTTPVT